MLANLVIVLMLGLVLVSTPPLVYAQLTMDNLNLGSSSTPSSSDFAQSVKDIIGWTTIDFDIDNEDERSNGLLEWEVNNLEAEIPKVCESNSQQCTYELDDAEFRENSASYAYVLEGTLKVGSELPDGSTETYNYDLRGSMDRIKTVERADGTTVEDMVGTIKIDPGNAAFNFDPEHMLMVSGNVTRDLYEGTGTVHIFGFGE